MKKYLPFLIVFSLVISLLPLSPLVTAAGTTTRLAGTNRIETAIEISKKAFPTNDSAAHIVLARSDTFPDALAGSALAGVSGPILITPSSALDSKVKDEIDRVLPAGGKVYILGGTGAIASAVETSLTAAGYTVERIGGADRYETSALIAKKVDTVANTKAIIATGENFPDALAAAAYSAKNGVPILLTQKDSLPASVKSALTDMGITSSWVIGGTGVVSDAVKNELPSATRVSGADRYATAVEVAKQLWDKTSGAAGDKFVVARGDLFPDALAGGPLAAINNAPLLLTQPTSVPAEINSYFSSLGYSASVSASLFILGGTGAISSSVENSLNTLASGGTPAAGGKPTISSLSTPSVDTIEVNFDTAVNESSAKDKGSYEIKNNAHTVLTIDQITVSSDGKKVTIRLTQTASNMLSNNLNNTIKVRNVRGSASGMPVDTTLKTIKPTDSDGPTITSAYANSKKRIVVIFNENINPASIVPGNFKMDGAGATSAVINPDNPNQVDVYYASALSAGSHSLNVSGVQDWAGNAMSAYTTSVSVVDDSTPPTIASATLKGYKTLQVVFSEKVTKASAETVGNYTVKTENNVANPVTKATLQSDEKTVLLNLTNSEKDGTDGIADVSISGGVLDLADNACTDSENFNVSADTAAPTILSIAGDDYNYSTDQSQIKVVFNEPVTLAGTYQAKYSDGTTYNLTAAWHPDDKGSHTMIRLSSAATTKLPAGSWTLLVSSVVDEAGNSIAAGTERSFSLNEWSRPVIKTVSPSGTQVTVTFKENNTGVNDRLGDSAKTTTLYKVNGVNPSSVSLTTVSTKNDSVVLTMPSGTTLGPGPNDDNLVIENMQDVGANYIDPNPAYQAF